MEPLRCRDCGGKAAAVVQLDRTLPPLCFSCGRWRLAERTEDLVALLLPNGVVEGRYYRVGSVAGEPGRSLVINLAGPRRGRWRDFATGDRGDGGDPIDLIAATVPACGGDLSKAFAWGIGDFLRISASGRELERTPRRGDPKSRPLDPNLDAVRRIWREARPLRRGDPVDRYLSERGCSFSELGRAPKALRYHESLWHSRVRAEFPAMIAGIVDPAGNLVAIHRTYLAIEEGGRVVKAPVPSAADRRDAKMSLGPVRGNCVRLWHGNGPAAWDKAGPDEVVVVGAGLEDCIAAVLEKPRHRVICGVSDRGMGAIELPAKFRNLVLIKQHDPLDGPAAQGLGRMVAKWRAEGRKVTFWRAPVFVKDLAAERQWKRQLMMTGE